MNKAKRLNIDFPPDELRRLKMICHRLGVTMKDFCTKKLVKAVEEHEKKIEEGRKPSMKS